MSLWRQVTHGARVLWRGRAADRDLDQEVAHFVDEAADELIAAGMTPAEARRAARLRLGSPLAIREEVRAAGWEHVIETFAGDVRSGIRQIRRRPGLAAVVVTTLALGIGAATAMLSVAGPVLAPVLPFADADRLHAAWDRTRNGERVEVAFGTFVEIEQRAMSFERMAVTRTWTPSRAGAGTPERLDGLAVSADFFRVYGVAPRVGRNFEAADDLPQAPPVVILSDGFWRRRFAADAAILGRMIALDGRGYEVIGVMPAEFAHRLLPATDVWRPLQYDRTLPSFQGREWGHHLGMMTRLRAGVSAADAIGELAVIARDPRPEWARPSWAAMEQGLTLSPLGDDLTREVAPALRAVLAGAALLLLVAGVNVVNLLIGRDAERRAELSLRSALGAGRGRVARQVFTETLVLAALGGAGGLLVAQALIRLLAGAAGTAVPLLSEPAPAATMFACALGVTTAVTVVVGVVPALLAGELRQAIQSGARQVSAPRRRTRRVLVIAEVSLALVLLVASALLFQSQRHLFAIAPGFDPDSAVAVHVQVAGPAFADPGASERFFAQALDAVRRVPGVTGAALTSQLPLSGEADVYGLRFESAAGDAGAADGGAFRYAVDAEYFEVMGIPLRRGRALDERDHAAAPLSVIISESVAASRFPGRDPIGQRLHAGPTDRPWFTVVGVAGNVKQLSLDSDWEDAVYVTPAQWHFPDRAMWIVARTAGAAAPLASSLREAIWSVDRDQPIVRLTTLAQVVRDTAAERAFALRLFQVFGFAALLLTAVGIYGVVSSGVTERRREIGVRVALGASRPGVVAMVVREALTMAGIGAAIGALGAAVVARSLAAPIDDGAWLKPGAALLYRVSPLDPAAYGAVAAVLFLVAALACWWPARRAVRIDPATALRAE